MVILWRHQEISMDLLDFARGPGLVVAMTVFVLGTVWRVVHLLRLPHARDLSPPREGAPGRARAAWDGIVRGMWPRREFGQSAMVTTFNGYVFHIGLALIVFGYAPHIQFVRRYTGLGWPALPDVVLYVSTAVTMMSLGLALILRLTDPVLRRISRADDMISWTLTFLPIFTGMAVISEPSATVLARDHVIYRDPLAIHLLSLELLLLWFPFGKLMHAVLFVFSRGATGIRFRHRGVEV
jgi:nitrate reductase gamma subunit